MKTKVLAFVLFAAISVSAIVYAQGEITSTKLGENVLVIKGGGGNITAIATEECVVVIDAFMTPVSARKARKTIESFSDKPIRYLINTHYHSDHTFGNQVFSDAVIVGHSACEARIKSRYGSVDGEPEFFVKRVSSLEEQLIAAEPDSEEAKALQEQLKGAREILQEFKGFTFTPPILDLNGGAAITLGGKAIQILHLGPGHSDTDLVVLVPDERLLVMGDLGLPGLIPYIDIEGGADPENWIAILDKLIQMEDQYLHVVPGHGDIGTVENLKEQRTCLNDLRQAVNSAWKRGLTLEQAKSEIKLEQYQNYSNFKRARPLNIENCWRFLEKKAASSQRNQETK